MLWELNFSSNSQLSGVSHLDVPGLKSGGPLLLTPPGLSLKFESGYYLHLVPSKSGSDYE